MERCGKLPLFIAVCCFLAEMSSPSGTSQLSELACIVTGSLYRYTAVECVKQSINCKDKLLSAGGVTEPFDVVGCQKP